MRHPDDFASEWPLRNTDLGQAFETIKREILQPRPKPFESTHKLPFEACPFEYDSAIMRYRIGTCEGIYGSSCRTYDIIAVVNNESGNGHFQDVLDWFENSCRRDKRSLRFMEIMNERLRKHLIEKRGFLSEGKNNVIKHFNI